MKKVEGGLGFDSLSGYLVLFGGFGGTMHSDTWAFTGGQWTRSAPLSNPQARAGFFIVDDGTDRCLVGFGGYTSNSVPSNVGDTWLFE
ncbi:MAG: hypothetical protein L3K15_08855 [Thermoplasmata archaeon]|nr:hypothetical protein [Thermoplasmata archaeon]